MVAIDEKSILKELRLRGQSFENTLYKLTLKDESDVNSEKPVQTHLVVPRQTQFSPLTDKPIAVNFLKYEPGSRLRIPIIFVNSDQSVDLRRGCFVVRVNQYVECVCDGEVPESILLDLSTAQKGDVFRLNSLQLPPQVRPSKNVPPDYVVCVIKSTKTK
mmetsp:Transcript_14567/g.19977  ORF Transcript_14567/g.19977 Transcript_14567/m.19977 type:complete len:160 (-) Transcript_14567:114-593(-)